MIFLNVDNLYTFHKQFHNDLMRLRMLGSEAFLQNLGSTMNKFIPYIRLYAPSWLRDIMAADLTVQMPGDDTL